MMPGGRLTTSPFFFFFFYLLNAVYCQDLSGPVFIQEPPNNVDFSNSTGTEIICQARGSPFPSISWTKSDGTPIGTIPGLRQVLENGNLILPPFRATDYKQEVHAQTYRCQSENELGKIISRDVHVRAVVSQDYELDVFKTNILLNNDALVGCVVPSHVGDMLEVQGWVDSEGVELGAGLGRTQFDGKYVVLPSGELQIRNVTAEDGFKTYKCRTKHRLTGETKLSATAGRLVITEPVGGSAPKFPSETDLSRLTHKEGNPLRLTCPAQASPLPSFRWYKFQEGTTIKKPVKLDDRVKQVGGTLIILEAQVEDSGKYLCMVNNSVGGESVETVLTVTAPLSAEVEPKQQVVDYGRSATFKCNYKGNPIKQVYWLKDGVNIGHSDKVLRIDSVKKEDKGMYQLV
ncbi:Down syndrome cell adhesion molecule-like protein Dscam2 [Eurytemora carolleeae]|uniref:Down syndrome cell adhesion molecule-like protein Dscam2 n=1 Tax=Eurytemora carolleeae TaxID=1294199 RepID=UPI000C776583|nr:Down syndrome cell adhesion molecule-like protein Dscam2 [Eurytemora carolleeae]|eukprot:XP_023322374.1 Down syndrome cell adhesion molecule-like protein Dscam2 [Eurytemora affinis]